MYDVSGVTHDTANIDLEASICVPSLANLVLSVCIAGGRDHTVARPTIQLLTYQVSLGRPLRIVKFINMGYSSMQPTNVVVRTKKTHTRLNI